MGGNRSLPRRSTPGKADLTLRADCAGKGHAPATGGPIGAIAQKSKEITLRCKTGRGMEGRWMIRLHPAPVSAGSIRPAPCASAATAPWTRSPPGPICRRTRAAPCLPRCQPGPPLKPERPKPILAAPRTRAERRLEPSPPDRAVQVDKAGLPKKPPNPCPSQRRLSPRHPANGMKVGRADLNQPRRKARQKSLCFLSFEFRDVFRANSDC